MSGGGGKGGGGSQVTGYRYSFGIHMGLGRGPVDEIVEVRVGDKTAWSPVIGGSKITDTQDVTIDQYNLFGGEGKEGGIQGTLQVMMGKDDQVASSGLRAMLGNTIPGFRRTVTAFFSGIVAMNNPYPKTWKFRMRRVLKGWDGDVFEPELALIPVGTDGTMIVGAGFFGESVLGFAIAECTDASTPHGNYATYNTPTPDPELFGEFGAPVTAKYAAYTTQGRPGDTGLVSGSSHKINTSLTYELKFSDGHYLPEVQSGCWFNLEFVDASGTVIFATACKGFEDGVSYYYWGSSLATAVRLNSFSGSTGGRITFSESGLSFLGYFFQCQALTITSVRMSGFRARSYDLTGDEDQTAYVILNIRRRLVPGRPVPADINGINSMNPAHIIYECLTNREWGRGFPASMLDTASFTACAQTLFDEGFGLCLKWSRSDSIDSFIQGVIDHIGAAYYQSRVTGLMTLKLIRGDYVVADVPMYDTDSGITKINESSISAPINGVNQIEVTYHDPITDEDLVVKVDSIAAIQAANGNINLLQKTYTGIPTASLAQRVAQRDLRAASSVLRRFSFNMDRRGRMLAPGSVIRIRDAARGIPETVVRIVTVEDGTNTSGEMTFTGVQDVFALPASSYAAPVMNTWQPPTNTPCLDIHRVIEMPYFLVNHTTSTADLNTIDPAAGFIGAMVARGSSTNVGYKIAVRDSAPTAEDYPTDTSQFCGFTPDWN